MKHQCEGLVQDEHESNCKRRCKRAAIAGDRLCRAHRNALNPSRRQYVIAKNYRPARTYTSEAGYTKYHRYWVGKAFKTRQEAETYMDMNWSLINKAPPGRRFVSATVEAIR